MAQSNTVGGGGVITRTKRVFLTSGIALQGYGVCYNFDATDVNSENKTQTSPVVSAANWADARRVQVTYPNNKNNNHRPTDTVCFKDSVLSFGLRFRFRGSKRGKT